MGSWFSRSNGEDEDDDERHLLMLLDEDDNIDDDDDAYWHEVRQRLRSFPEEAAAYGHGLQLSPLQRCLLLSLRNHRRNPPPPDVVVEFVEAYPEAVFGTDHHGRTALFTAVQASAQAQAAAVVVDDWNDATFEQQQQEQYCKIVEYLLEWNKSAASRHCSTLTSSSRHYRQQAGQIPLHLAKDVGICQLLLRAHPRGVLQTDAQQQQTPLHSLVRNITNIVLTTTPTTIDDDDTNNGDEEPTHDDDDAAAAVVSIAVSCRPAAAAAAVQCMIQAAQQLDVRDGGVCSSKDVDGKSPLDLVCDQLVHARKATTKNNKNKKCNAIWSVLLVLIEAAYRATTTTSQNSTNTTATTTAAGGDDDDGDSSQSSTTFFPILHALVALKCPVGVIEHALAVHPHLAGSRDDNGYTPLMLAAVTHGAPEILCTLLRAFPQAARMTDTTGRLPIDVAASEFRDYNDALWDVLVAAEPRAIDTRDLRDKQFPFQAAALAKQASLSTVYRLLRAKPHVISFLLRSSSSSSDGRNTAATKQPQPQQSSRDVNAEGLETTTKITTTTNTVVVVNDTTSSPSPSIVLTRPSAPPPPSTSRRPSAAAGDDESFISHQ